MEEGYRLLVLIGFKLRMDVDDESRAGGREQVTCLSTRVHEDRHTHIKVVLGPAPYFLTQAGHIQ
jgi:hypothetical protein